MAVFVGLWLLWFARGLMLRDYVVLAVALAAPVVILSPVLWHFRQVHEAMGLARALDDIKRFSADIVGFFTAPEQLALWGSIDGWHRPEGDVMPGVVAVLLVVTAAVMTRSRITALQMPNVVVWFRRLLLVVIIAEIGIAMLPWFVGPVAFTFAGINVSTRGQDKPLAVAFVCAVAWLVTSKRFVAAFTARSTFAFYCVATAVMFVLALGPEGRFMDHPVLYKAPYSWLMLLPGFENSFRAPARFAMVGILALSVAAGLAFVRLATRVPHRAHVLAAAVMVAILAESWIAPFPLAPAPAPFALPSGVPQSAAVLELPTGVYEDALAMFHTTVHHRKTVNGMSGYTPPHYQILEHALMEGDAELLTVFRRYSDLVVVTRRDRADAMALTSRLGTAADTVPLQETAAHLVTVLEMEDAHSHATTGGGDEAVPPAAISTHEPVASLQDVSDDDYRTAWSSEMSQNGTEMIALALREPRAMTGIEVSVGMHIGAYARELVVEVSDDGRLWRPVATAKGSTAAFEAAIRDPKRIPITIRFAPTRGSHVRIRQTGKSRAHWAVAELRVLVRPFELR